MTKSIGNYYHDKFIVEICPYLDNECKCSEQALLKPFCKDVRTCLYKNLIDICPECKDDGRFELIMSTKHLTHSGEFAKKILKLLKVRLVKE